MGKSYTHTWTPEKLALESRQNVETIRKNAICLGAKELIEMCDGDLKSRAPAKVKRVGQTHAKLSDSMWSRVTILSANAIVASP